MRFPLTISVVFVLSLANLTAAKYSDIAADDKLIYDKYIDLDKNVRNLVNYGVKVALPYVMEASEHVNLSSSCANNLFALMSGIKGLKLSAVKFLDASGKIPPGLITGTVSMLGDYDECLDAEVLRANGKVAFRGQYCMLDIRPVLPKPKRRLTMQSGFEELLDYTKNTSEVLQYALRKAKFTLAQSVKYALCIPSGCTTDDVTMILNYFGEKVSMNATVQYCEQKQEYHMHPGMVIAIVFFFLAGLLAIVGSSMDYYSRKKKISFENKIANYLMCFSIPTNFPKAISTKTQDSTLSSVFGIRTLTLFFVILMHQYFFWGVLPIHGHSMTLATKTSELFFQIPYNGFLATEVFFFLGGLVNTYSRMKIQERSKHQPTILQIFIHRLWRIFPTYIFSMLTFYLFINLHGPMGPFLREEFFEPCDEKWWKNLLFINNLFNQKKVCMMHTWYLAADMQLFLISLFTVPVLLKNEKVGLILHLGVLIAGLIGTTLWAWHKDLMPSLIAYYLDLDDLQRVQNAYVSPLTHVAPYFTGLLTGYLLSKWNDFKIPKMYRLLGWPIAAVSFVSMLFMTKIWNSGVEYTMVESALYFAFSRFLFVLSVAWIVVCCTRGYGGVVNYILSLKIWIPFSRISYMVYMISPILQFNYYGTLKMRIDIDNMTFIWRHIGDLGTSCLMGLVMAVIIESPFISMEKLIFHRTPAKKISLPNNVETAENNINTVGDMIKEMKLDKIENNGNEITQNIEMENNIKTYDLSNLFI